MGDWDAKEPQAPRPDLLDRLLGRETGLESKGSLELVVRPRLYPVVTLIWKEEASHGKIFEADIPLRRNIWLDLANTWKEHAARVDARALRESIPAWSLAADLIMSEIRAEEKRERNREAYDSFGDFVASLSRRTDLDNIRKAQMIHDKASELELH